MLAKNSYTSLKKYRYYILLILAICPIYLHAAGLGGSWYGTVTQDDPPLTYTMEMVLYGDVGNIHYMSLGCSGNLQFIRSDGTSYWYREHITFGKNECIDGGIIQLRRHPLGDSSTWDWKWEGGGVTVRGVISGSGVEE